MWGNECSGKLNLMDNIRYLLQDSKSVNMEKDEELERIRLRRLEEIMKYKNGSGTPVDVTDNTFEDVIKRNSLVVIDCWASWCGPCRMIAPIVEELAKEYAGKILFGKLNVDENQRIPLQHQIMSIPTLLVFKNGQLVDRIIGAVPKKVLEQKIGQYV